MLFSHKALLNDSISVEGIFAPYTFGFTRAFSVEKNANKLKAKLNSWNYNSTIIKNEKIMRVSYDNFDTKEEALISLSKIRKENPQAWILTI